MITDEALDFLGAWIIAVCTWFFGGLDGVVKVLIAFTVIDYITGLCAAWIEHKISSEEGFKGIARKVGMFAFVGIAHIVDTHLLGGSDGFREVVCLFYIGNEGISILENADTLGVPFPKWLRNKFMKFTEHEEEKKLA